MRTSPRWANPPGARGRVRKHGVYLGQDLSVDNQVRLPLSRFQTGVHILGPTGTGKTQFLMWCFQQFCRVPNATVIVINPKGNFGRLARDWVLNHGLTKRLFWFSPGDGGPVPGWNPLRPNGLPRATHAKAVREGILAGWGQHTLDQTAQLARFLYLSLGVARECCLGLVEAAQVLQPHSEMRRVLLPRIQDPYLRQELKYLNGLTKQRQEQLVQSSLARIDSFINDPMLRHIVSQPNSANLGEMMDEGRIIIQNIELYRPLRRADVQLLGRLFINDVISHVFARPPSRRGPVFLIVDELHLVATEDLCIGLELGRELGLNTVVAHQHLGQLDDRLRDSLLTCARTKIVFGGLAVEQLEPLVTELFMDQFDPWEVKDEITSLEVEPVNRWHLQVAETDTQSTGSGRSRGTSRTRGISKTRTHGEQHTWSYQNGVAETNAETESSGTSSGSSSSSGTGQTIVPNEDGTEKVLETTSHQAGVTEGSFSGRSSMTARTVSRSSGASDGWSTSDAEGESESEGDQESTSEQQTTGTSITRTWIQITDLIKRRVVTGRKFLAENEFMRLKLQKVQALPQAHFVAKTAGSAAVFVRAPYVRVPVIGKIAREKGMDQVYALPFYMSPEEALDQEAEVVMIDAEDVENEVVD